MVNRIAATRPRASARRRAWLGTSTIGRSLSGVALAGFLLAGCAGANLSGGQSSPPRLDSAAQRLAAASAGTLAADPASIHRRRQALAELVNGYPDFRTISWVRLIDAKLAGPIERNKSTIYCASAQLMGFLGPVETMVIRVERSNDGTERLDGWSGGLFECMNANYGPFPELEQERARQRKAHGEPD
jgi:hypothetical protein